MGRAARALGRKLRAAEEEMERQEEDRERRAEERERNPHVFTFDHGKIRCDDDFHKSIYEQGLGYADYWDGGKWSRLNLSLIHI